MNTHLSVFTKSNVLNPSGQAHRTGHDEIFRAIKLVQAPPFRVCTPILRALKQVRRMHGGSQAQLLRCDDKNSYVVKFQNNPQGIKILANELFTARLARRLQLPAPFSAVIQVTEPLIAYTDDLVIELRHGRTMCNPELQFGSRYPASLVKGLAWDFLPDCELRRVDNLRAFPGILAFNKWTCNTDERQTVFVRSFQGRPFHALMIDNGFCFNGVWWNFPDAPRRSLYSQSRVYESVTGIKSFEPWLSRIETMTERTIRELAREVPLEWLDLDTVAFELMVKHLWRRRKRVRELIVAAVETSPEVFPNWELQSRIPRVRKASGGTF